MDFRFSGLVLAAGMSSRMGAFKPLLPFRGMTVIENTVSSVFSGGAERVVTVVGKNGDEVQKTLRARFGEKVIIGENPDFQTTDMMTSVKIGCALIKGADGFFILPGDMPMISPDTFRLLSEKFSEKTDAVFPVISKRRKHPALVSSRVIPGIMGYDGDDGLRGFFRTLSNTAEVEIDDPGAEIDFDTPKDYEKFRT